ncbi:MAG: hypothetical protein IIT65_06525 [Lachnospiraceae bacterium]|nr:hypothetical protein [Lachnospiraceae bacterium]
MHLTPEGKLKQATKEAEKLQKTAKEAEDNLSSLKSLESTYQEKSEQVNIATTEEDRQKAVQERNEAVLDAIKENGSLAEYVVTEVIDNEITITINEDALANAITNAADALNKAEINAGFADARVSLAQAKVSKEDFLQWYRSYNLDTWETDTKENSNDELYGKLID